MRLILVLNVLFQYCATLGIFCRVPPTPLQIFSNESPTSLILVCQTAAFSPERLNITWYKNGSVITSGTKEIKEQNTEGLYEVSSKLNETGALQIGTNYTCQVEHICLQTAASVHHVIHISGTDRGFTLVFMYLCIAVGLLILILMIIIVKSGKLLGFKDLQGTEDTTEEQLSYAALNFAEPRKHSNRKQIKKNVHTQIPQMETEERLTYCALDFVGQKKVPGPTRHEETSVYAHVQFKKQNSMLGTQGHVRK
ncbi:tyrosine-protein phosphatase non-receptor type substrate 1-like [Heterodontus francisci]|uniref:tyrosine-protein phosphatase non-receptor type substrate 1-like n=1 Tax=Heterodontus francisci TaxID=7792 RepID=UPI00355ACDFD